MSVSEAVLQGDTRSLDTELPWVVNGVSAASLQSAVITDDDQDESTGTFYVSLNVSEEPVEWNRSEGKWKALVEVRC